MAFVPISNQKAILQKRHILYPSPSSGIASKNRCLDLLFLILLRGVLSKRNKSQRVFPRYPALLLIERMKLRFLIKDWVQLGFFQEEQKYKAIQKKGNERTQKQEEHSFTCILLPRKRQRKYRNSLLG